MALFEWIFLKPNEKYFRSYESLCAYRWYRCDIYKSNDEVYD